MNSLYDPDLTGTGHQPYGYDQLKVFFQNYLVTEVTIEMQVVQQTYNGDTVTVSFLPWYSATAPPTAQDYLAEVGSESIQLPAGQVVKYKRTFSLPEILAIAPAEYLSDTQYRTAVGANPTLAPVFNLSYTCGSATQPTFTVRALLTYKALFTDSVFQAQS